MKRDSLHGSAGRLYRIIVVAVAALSIPTLSNAQGTHTESGQPDARTPEWFAPPEVAAENAGPKIAQYLAKAEQVYQKGDLNSSIVALRLALRLAKTAQKPRLVLAIEDELVYRMYTVDRSSRGERQSLEFARTALLEHSRLDGPNDPQTGMAAVRLALALEISRREGATQAESLWRQAIECFRTDRDQHPGPLAMAEGELADNLVTLKRYQEAYPYALRLGHYWAQTFASKTQDIGAQRHDAITVLVELVLFWETSATHPTLDQRRALLTLALKLQQENAGANELDVSSLILGKLTQVALDSRDWKLAESYGREAWESGETQNYRIALEAGYQVYWALDHQGRATEADNWLRKVLSFAREKDLESSPEAARAMAVLAGDELFVHENEETAKLLHDSIPILLSEYPDDPLTAMSLEAQARILSDRHDVAAAKTTKDALALAQKHFGQNSYPSAQALDAMGYIYENADQWDAAERWYRQAHDMLKGLSLPPGAPDAEFGLSAKGLADSLFMQNKQEDLAYSLYQETLDVMSHNPDYIEVMAETYAGLCNIAYEKGSVIDAGHFARSSLDTYLRLQKLPAKAISVGVRLSGILAETDHLDEAEKVLSDVDSHAVGIKVPDDARLHEAVVRSYIFRTRNRVSDAEKVESDARALCRSTTDPTARKGCAEIARTPPN